MAIQPNYLSPQVFVTTGTLTFFHCRNFKLTCRPYDTGTNKNFKGPRSCPEEVSLTTITAQKK